ncbi:SusC/RagA family TonB-linked outer membrane protein [Belliella marina]|uniref:SusC/RagA family TonB-linked outer membrane protein n=1 Tax=Belliella marina TaxID=1644146 RepID=A0ABW4VMK8_9BACT
MKQIIPKRIRLCTKFIMIIVMMAGSWSTETLAYPNTFQKESLKDIKVSIVAQKWELTKVFKSLESQSSLKFSYNETFQRIEKNKVTLDLPNTSMEEVLMKITEQSNLKFLRINNNIHVAINDSEGQAVKELDESDAMAEITGVVFDEDGVTLPGVTVRIKGTTRGTVTDVDGSFNILADEGEVLIFSYVGFLAQEVTIVNQTDFRIRLEEDKSALDEVVVIGYGTVRREDLTGSVSSINMEELKDLPVTSPLQAIQGRMAGVHITVTEGSPDADIKIRVRGGGSITQDNSPLYVVDGFVVNSINDIPPQDIKSIDVLKDAASTAIYGSQGANGVVLITTKSGKPGKPEVSFNTYTSMKRVYGLTDVLSPYEFVYLQKELDAGASINTSFYGMYGLWEDVDIYRSREGIDWQNDLFGNTGVHQNYNVSVSGGGESVRYLINYTRDDEKFIMLNSAYKRDNISLKLNKQISDKISIDFFSRMTNMVITGPSVSNGRMLRDGVKFAPTRSLTFIPEGSLAGIEDISSAEALSSLNDPIYNITNEHKVQDRFNHFYNVGLNWEIAKNLEFSSKGTYGFENNLNDNIWLSNTGQASANGGQPVARREDIKGSRWSVQNTLSYDWKSEDKNHDLKLLVGQEVFNFQNRSTLVESKFFPKDFDANDVLAMWNYGVPSPTYTRINEPTRTSSFFSRANYMLADKYILTVTARVDGKNVFAPNNRWGFFPAAAFAWKLSEEGFMKNVGSWLSSAKMRLSYGEVGNARVGSYWRQEYSFVNAANRLIYINGEPQSSLQPSTVLRNENLTWESTVSQNIGLDFGLFNNRTTVVLDVYKNTTKDLILAVRLPSNSGYATQFQNVGSTSNRGLEISTSTSLISNNNFHLSGNFNISFNRNRIEQLDGSDYLIASSGWGLGLGSDDFRAVVGEPLGQIYGYVSDGMYSFDDFTFDGSTNRWIVNEGVADISSIITTSGNHFGPGHIKVKKLGGEGDRISPDHDRTVIGNTQPKHTGGFGFNGGFRGFDFNILFNWSYGNDVYNANKIDYTTYANSRRYNNMSSIMSLENRFSTIDPVTGNNVMFGNFADPARLQEINQNASIWHPISNRSLLTDWAIEDGSFLRLGNLTVGYTLPSHISQKVFVKNLRVYVAGYNLALWTNYSGQDPEVDTRRSPLTPGVDYSAYPKARTVLGGINITF